MAKKSKKKEDVPKEQVTNCDWFKSLKNSSSAPYTFTEQGISMLSAVVTSQKAWCHQKQYYNY